MQSGKKIKSIDVYIQTTKPFQVYKTHPDAAKKLIQEILGELSKIANALEPFIPTAILIKKCIVENKMPETPLFVRKD